MGKKSKVCSETDLIKGNFAIGPPLQLAGEGGAPSLVLGNASLRECVATLERAPDATAWAWVLPASIKERMKSAFKNISNTVGTRASRVGIGLFW